MIYSKATVMPIFDRGTTDLTDNNRDILHLELFKKLNVPVVVMTNATRSIRGAVMLQYYQNWLRSRYCLCLSCQYIREQDSNYGGMTRFFLCNIIMMKIMFW